MNRTKSVFTLLFVIIVVGTPRASAQNDREYHSAFHFSFFPPLSSHGSRASQYTNDFSLSLLAGVSKNERAFALAGLGNTVLNDASGALIAGLWNYTGGDGEGLQFGGLANIVRGDYMGLQFGGLVNTAKELEGFQFAGLANIAGDVDGFQFGGLANVAGDVEGFQFGGLFNVARDVEGVQFAGLVNIADHSDYPIGIVNIIRDGEMGIAVGYNEVGTTSLTFRSGGRVMYGILGLGYNHKAPKKEAWGAVAGYGAHINILPWFRINNEITTETFGIFSGEENDTFKAGYALLPAFRPARHVEIFGGPSISYMYSTDERMFGMFPKNSLWDDAGFTKHGDRKLQKLFVGWQAGVQYLF